MNDSTEQLSEYSPAFQWFGGKARVASVVWDALGDVESYTEPFFGSGAMLFLRPPSHTGERREQVNDFDGFVANFWRAVKADPEGVASYCDWPCNEIDMTARHAWLVSQAAAHKERMLADPEYFDSKIAGWWCWGQCWWIGGGWCDGKGPWSVKDGVFGKHGTRPGVSSRRPHLGDDGQGVNRKRPHLSDDGRGVNRQLPHLSDDGQGVNRQRPHLSDDGRGVNRQLPHLSNDGTCADYSAWVRLQIQRLSDRLRRVRVCCGDWSRVVTPSASSYKPSDKGATVGIFLDPPYSAEANRDMGCYATDCGKVAHDVREWCVEAGKDSRLRIALCGYEGEHGALESLGWRVFAWKSNGMNTIAKSDTQGQANTDRERIWFSPGCVCPVRDGGLFS